MQSKTFTLLEATSKSADFQTDPVDLGFTHGFSFMVNITSASSLDSDIFLEGSCSDTGPFAEIPGSRLFASENANTGWNVPVAFYKRIRVAGEIRLGSATFDVEGTIKSI